MKNFVKINEVIFASIICIFAYGLFGIGAPGIYELNSDAMPWFNFISPVVFISLYFIINKKVVDSDLKIFFFDRRFVASLLAALFIAFLMVFYIDLSITGDQLYYSNYAFIHSVKLLPMLSSVIPDIQSFQAATIIKVISFLLLIVFSIFFLILHRLHRFNYLLFLSIVVLSIIFLRTLIVFLGGNPVIHAPFSSVYLMFFAPILGINDFGLQASYAFVYAIFGISIFLKISNLLSSNTVSALLTISIFSIPAFFFLGSTIEPSIFSIICYSLVLLSLTSNSFVNYKNLVYLILFFSFFRIAAIFSLVPILLHMILNKNLNKSLRDNGLYLLNIFSPVLLFIPFFIHAFISGSAATSGASFSLIKILNIVLDGTMWSLYMDTFSIFLLLIYLFLLCITIKHDFTKINVAFLLLLSVIFFSINESLWTFAKYRLEVFIPLFLSQSFFFIKLFISNPIYKKMFFIFLISIIFFNIKNIFNFPEVCSEKKGTLENHNMRFKINYGCNYFSRVPYSYKEAFHHVSEKNKLSATYLPGVNYGAFIHILNNATVSDYISSQKIWDRQEKVITMINGGNFSASPEFINSDNEIQYIILAFTQDIDNIRHTLIDLGWSTELTYENKYGLPVYVLSKN
jgi:hypothetical protein